VYILLCASPPFHGKTDAEMNAKIKRGEYAFPDKYWKHISASAKDFIQVRRHACHTRPAQVFAVTARHVTRYLSRACRA
jgi:hypothetical protein